jgi:aspartyl aminopeptidase
MMLDDLMTFLGSSPTPFHAAANLAAMLSDAGFEELDEKQQWQLEQGGKYFILRNGSSIAAWVVGESPVEESGINMVGAHTDSPCLRVKPDPELLRQGVYQLGVEVYGGALLNPWFDRDLSIAGRVTYLDGNNALQSALIDFGEPVAVIPSLAIHLDREANEKRTVNNQKHLPPLVMLAREKQDFRKMLSAQLQDQGYEVGKVLDHELSLYDTQKPALTGLNKDFLASARLDNLLSCFAGVSALLAASDSGKSSLLICNDHEEVGSASAAGAQGPMLQHLLERWMPDNQLRNRAISHSVMISVDNAHAVHPNYAEKHDDNHGPRINGGPVIKVNANQRYASNSETQALFRHLCEEEGVPVQSFVVRSDMACGSTIGPITATEIGVPTVDVGVPQLAMHSVREMCGSKDPEYLCRVLKRFYSC